MSNSFYNHGAFPSTGSAATSASMRAELDLISAGFDKMPTLAGNANKFVVINSTGTGMTQTDVLPAFTVTDTDFTVQDDGDNTRKFQFNAGSITTGNTRIYSMPDLNTTLVGTDVTQTLTNKTLTSPVIATIVNTGTLTLPTSTDTLIGRNTTDTLTNKTLTNPVIGTIINTGTLTLPTSTDTLVGRATTDTLTNKTISGANNTLSNIGNSSLTNSSVVIGSSTLSLGGTLTTLAGVTISGASNTLSNIANASLTNSSVTINSTSVALGASATITAANPNALTIGTGLSGTSYTGSAAVTIAIDSTVATLSGSQTLSNKTISGSSNTLSNIANASLTNSSITIGSSAISLGSTASTITGLTSLSSTGLVMTANAASSTAISAIAQSAGTVTVTAAGHGLTSGDMVSIDGVADYTYTGLVTVNVTNANVFTYSRTTTNASSSGGYVTKVQGTWASYSGGTGPSYKGGPMVISASSQMPGLRVTQAGNGYAFIVEDATNPDTSAFIIANDGSLSVNTNKFTVDAATGNTVIAGTTSFGGNIVSNILFTDATYDIGATGANRPRDLFLSRNLVVGGTLTLAGGVNLNGNVTIGDASSDTLTINSTITGNLIFTDNTYDIGASGATRPRNAHLAGSLLIGGAASGNSKIQAAQAGINATSLTTTTVLNLGTRLGFTGVTNADGYIFGGIAMGGNGEEYAGIAAYDNGSAAATGLKFFTGTTGGIVEAVTIDSTGKVGIGGSPSFTLSVANSTASVASAVQLRASTAGDIAKQMVAYAGTELTSLFGAWNGSQFTTGINIAYLPFTFGNSASSEYARFDAGGRFLVGTNAYTASSSEKFEVYGGMSLLDFNSDSVATLYVKNRSTTSATIQPYIYFADSGGNRGGMGVKTSDSTFHQYAQGGINWYTGSAGFAGLAATLDTSGNLFLGSSGAASQQLTFSNATGGIGLGFGTDASNYSNIFSTYGSGAIVVAGGIQGNRSSDAYTSSYGGGSMYRTAIRVDAFNGNGIQFFVNPTSTTIARGTAVAMTEVGRFSTAGYFGIGSSNPSTNLTIGGTAASGGAGGTLGVFLSRGVTTNFYEAFDGTKSFIAGVDNTLTYAKVGTLSAHDLGIITGNGVKILVASTGRVTIDNGEYTVIKGSVYGKTPSQTGFSFGYNPSGGAGEAQLVWGTSGSTFPFIISSYDGTSTSERARFTTTGNLGVGNAVQSNINYQFGTNLVDSFGTIPNCTIDRRLGVSTATNSPVLSLGYYSSAYGLDLWVGTTGLSPCYIDVRQNEALIFRNNTYTGTAKETARFDATGNFKVGINSPTINLYTQVNHATGSSNGASFFVSSYNGTQIGDIAQSTTSSVVYNTTSDYRLKNNPQPLTGSGDFIDALKPKTWTWATDGSKGAGFIAHEFAEVSPTSVTGQKDAVDENGNPKYQGMQASTAEVIANLVAEIQSLRKRLAAANL